MKSRKRKEPNYGVMRHEMATLANATEEQQRRIIHQLTVERALKLDAAFEAALPKLLEEVNAAQRRGMDCLGLFVAHPTRLRYKQFWDALNYDRGQNTQLGR